MFIIAYAYIDILVTYSLRTKHSTFLSSTASLCSLKFLSFSHDLTVPIVGSAFQLTGRHDLIGLSRSVEIFAASPSSSTSGSKATASRAAHARTISWMHLADDWDRFVWTQKVELPDSSGLFFTLHQGSCHVKDHEVSWSYQSFEGDLHKAWNSGISKKW